ncbi:MAG: CDGSH iron-sulfur domain-containing protein [Rhodospirillales bacterium]|nr:CDGSH iron-sulfur domain-containing protein [Rhodospirillales bacterium]
MSRPIIAGKKPIRVDLEAGKSYYWCRCGRSKTQPFCDGSHKGTSLEPLEFKVDKSETRFLCQCKGTTNAPFCDGSHSRLGAHDIGSELPDIAEDRPPSAELTP